MSKRKLYYVTMYIDGVLQKRYLVKAKSYEEAKELTNSKFSGFNTQDFLTRTRVIEVKKVEFADKVHRVY